MPSFLSRLFGAGAPPDAPREAKYSRAAKMLAMHAIGMPQWTPRNDAALTREGFERNAICHRAVRMIAEAAASVPWLMFHGREEIIEHPLLELLERPNPSETGVSFLESVCSNLLLFGNAYIEAAFIDGEPREIYSLRPDRMRIEPGRNGWPAAYIYSAMGDRVRYEISGEGVEPILHIKFFNPLDDHYGFPPLAAAQVALDTHNAASFWNKALLDNSARPSGALVYAGPDGAHLTDEQFDRLRAELEESFSGSPNAGRPLLLEGGLDWKALSLSPKDMDFAQTKSTAAREIALAFGVPPLLLGLPGDNTFRNYQEANRAFWRQTIIPLVVRLQKSVQAWAQPGFEPFRFDYNVDRIDALSAERAAEWRRIDSASFLTVDEKREAAGYGAMPKEAASDPAPALGGSWEQRYSPDQPRAPAGSREGGQWTSGGGEGTSGAAGDEYALNVDPSVASDVGNQIARVQNRRVGRFPEASASQLDRLESSRFVAAEAETRVRESDPEWKPEPSLSDPNNIESRIAANENIARQANARYSEILREKYGDIALLFTGGSVPSTTLTGPRAPVLPKDDAETRRGAERENESADILWLNNHNVEQKPRVPGPKNPDYRIDSQIFDNYAPRTGNVRNIWRYVADKVETGQAPNIIINLADSTAKMSDIAKQFNDYPIGGLGRLWIVDQNRKLIYLLGGW